MNLEEAEIIKKSKIQYLRCNIGNLHHGEQLTFVCVDPGCTKRGLICPVCRANSHADHKTIPLKLFLQEVKDRFFNQNSDEDIISLSDYLRQLDLTKQKLLEELEQTVKGIALKIKETQTRIRSNYNNLRTMILTQSTISKKLPSLIMQMIEPSADRDQERLLDEFQKYASLIKLEADKLRFFDHSKSLIEQYALTTQQLKSQLAANLTQISGLFDNLPLSVDPSKVVVNPVVSQYVFSATQRHPSIAVSNDGKEIYISDGSLLEENSAVLVKSSLPSDAKQIISFKIQSTSEPDIEFGMLYPDNLVQNRYCVYPQVGESESEDSYKVPNINNKGICLISSYGDVNSDCYVAKQEEEISNDSACDVTKFRLEAKDIVKVQWDPSSKTFRFSIPAKPDVAAKMIVMSNMSNEEVRKLRVGVVMHNECDRVKIL